MHHYTSRLHRFLADCQLSRRNRIVGCPIKIANSSSCPVCGWSNFKTPFTLAGGEYSAQRCINCQSFTIFSASQRSYQSSYYSYQPTAEVSIFYRAWSLIQKRLLKGRYQSSFSLVRFFSKRLRGFPPLKVDSVLDVGCGAGLRLSTLSDYVDQRFGVDISLTALRHAALQGNKVTIARGEALPFREGYFDAVISSHSLEHSTNPHAFAAELYRVVRPGGYAIVGTPNAQSLSRIVLGKWWRAWDPNHHVVIFTTESLQRLLEEVGFKTCVVRHVSTGAYWVDSWFIGIENHISPRVRQMIQIMLYVLVRPLAILTNVLEIGDDIEIVAQKTATLIA